MSDKKVPISVVISAVDNVTYKVMGINQKLEKVTKPIGKIGSALSTLSAESGFTGLMKGLGEIGSTGKELVGAVAESFAKLAGTALAAGTAIYETVHSFSESGDRVHTLSRRLGLTTDAYQELAYAANKAQVPQEEFDASMTKLSKGIGEAAAGTGEAFIAFNALGINVRDAHGKIKPLGDLLPVIADKLGSVHNQSLRNTLAMKIFGKQGAQLNEIFNEGSEGLSRLRKEAHSVGAVMTPEQIKAATEFDDGMKSVMATLTMVRNVVGASLAPQLLKLGQILQKYILDHQEDIKRFADEFAKNLPGYIDQLIQLFKNMAAVITPIVGVFNMLASAFGGFNVAMGAFLLYLGTGPLGALFKFIGAIGKTLPAAIEFATTAFGLLWEVVVGVFTFIASIVGWPVTIALAIVGAFALMYNKIKPFADFVDGLVAKVKGLFGAAGSADLNGTMNVVPAPGPDLDFNKPVDASARNSSSKNENHLVVDFNNLPRGSRVETKKADSSLDLNMGYAGAGF